MQALGRAGEDGLDGEAHHLGGLRSALDGLNGDGLGAPLDIPWKLAELDLLASDALLLLASHLDGGAVDPAGIETEWFVPVLRRDPIAALEAVARGAGPEEALAAWRPSGPEYAGLREGLRRYAEAVARGGWPVLPPGPPIRPGAAGPRVKALRERLAADGDLAVPPPESAPAGPDVYYDESVAAAVRRFQARHGLAVDGLAGLETQAAMSVTAEARLEQVKVNLERRRWLPRDFGPR